MLLVSSFVHAATVLLFLLFILCWIEVYNHYIYCLVIHVVTVATCSYSVSRCRKKPNWYLFML